MFCVSCGRKAAIGSLCEGCFTKERGLFLTEDSEVKMCSCGSYFDKKWQEAMPFDEIINEYMEHHMVKLGTIKSMKIDFKKVGNTVIATIDCRGNIPPAKKIKSERKIMRIKIRNIKCDKCTKILGGYYEAVIQARGSNAESIIKKISGGIAEKVKNGYDVTFVSKAEAARIANSLGREFSMLRSFKFVTEKKGKKLYRNYYAIR